MDILEATAAYERWLAQHLTIVDEDLAEKHRQMATGGPFPFFRATYYRWLQRLPDLVPTLDGPVVAVVGDLHLENFGTWRTSRGRLAWGINDFDESECLPYAFDLARLATSASLAITAGKVPVDPTAAHRAVLRGYTTGLTSGGEPFVLGGGRRERLAKLVQHAVTTPAAFWPKLTKDPVHDLPHACAATLRRVLPTPDWTYRCYPRFAGLGSRGHRRYVAVGRVRGGDTECRELKEMCPPAGRWLGRPRSTRALDTPLVRAPDRWQARHGHWSARRLAPDCIKLELTRIDVADRSTTLFEWMGRETANVHLGTDRRDAVLRDLAKRPPDWLSHAAETLVDAVEHDWRCWSDHHGRGTPAGTPPGSRA